MQTLSSITVKIINQHITRCECIDLDFAHIGFGLISMDSYYSKDSGTGFLMCNKLYLIDKGLRGCWNFDWFSGYTVSLVFVGLEYKISYLSVGLDLFKSDGISARGYHSVGINVAGNKGSVGIVVSVCRNSLEFSICSVQIKVILFTLLGYLRISINCSACRFTSIMRMQDVTAWTSMMTGYAIHGRAKEALVLFKAITNSKVVPNDVTFIHYIVSDKPQDEPYMEEVTAAPRSPSI
ncbi:putative pentatricopeptide repeat-containing protein [Tanacetum coccineum]